MKGRIFMKKFLCIGIMISILFLNMGRNFTIKSFGADIQNQNKTVFKGVHYHFEDNTNTLWLRVRNVSGYGTMILENPNRIVIDIENMISSHKMETIVFDLSFIKGIRYAQIDRDTAKKGGIHPDTLRLVLDVEEKLRFTTEMHNRDLIIKVTGENMNKTIDLTEKTVSRGGNVRGRENEVRSHQDMTKEKNLELTSFEEKHHREEIDEEFNEEEKQNSKGEKIDELPVINTMGNIEYRNTGDRVVFLIKGAKLTSGRKDLTTNFTARYDGTEKKYVITFENKFAKLGTGVLSVGDGLVESISVIKDSKQTRIIIDTIPKFDYQILTRTSENDTAITLLKPAKKSEKLVVIDPGHGGRDPGAIADGITEADLNLDIALRLNKLLQEKKIKTYILREDDSYLDLYERAYIANKLNASLFLSIHNNAALSKVAKGTETLYFESKSSKFNGRDFAAILQREMVKTLSTTNRGIVNRQNLVVLKETKMPAALVEIAFMSNAEDMAKLKSEEFLQKSAESLCDGILMALKNIQ